MLVYLGILSIPNGELQEQVPVNKSQVTRTAIKKVEVKLLNMY